MKRSRRLSTCTAPHRRSIEGAFMILWCVCTFGLAHSFPAKTIPRKLLERVRSNDRAGTAAENALPFIVGGEPVGLVLPPSVDAISQFPSVIRVNDDSVELIDDTDWDPDAVVQKRSELVNSILLHLRSIDAVPALRGWRDEPFAVRQSFHAEPSLIIERAGAVLFGVPAYGVFLNGYTCEDSLHSRPTHVWLGLRSETKATWPGRMDSLAAGGLAAGMLPYQAMRDECAEEAGISEQLLEGLVACSAVSYTGYNDDMWGLKRDVLFCFDLELPSAFEPVAVDGEMSAFVKKSIGDLIQMLAVPIQKDDDSDNAWKPNVGVVLIDFLVRHGAVDVDDPSFLELVDALRNAKCA